MLLYDGACGACSRWARFLAGRLPLGYRVLPYQEHPDLEAVGLTRELASSSVWWIDVTGEPRGGADAIAAALVAIGGWLGVVGHLMSVPPLSQIASMAYRVLRRLTHRSPGVDACRTPS
ncbi:MAG: hypothetical protein KatS3mg008_1880 [Acidimicrobiales bacterium]|nr:MAG: hypothetical protein KatS3mg008_1880 [Acidimicrobiales bacterium]